MQGLVWECSCGKMITAEEPPEECVKCGNLDSFMQIPEDVLKSREQEIFEDDDSLEGTLNKSLDSSKKTRKTSKIKKSVKSKLERKK